VVCTVNNDMDSIAFTDEVEWIGFDVFYAGSGSSLVVCFTIAATYAGGDLPGGRGASDEHTRSGL